jgi:hypothetical protein
MWYAMLDLIHFERLSKVSFCFRSALSKYEKASHPLCVQVTHFLQETGMHHGLCPSGIKKGTISNKKRYCVPELLA